MPSTANQTPVNEPLPRLAYVSDVPIRNISAGPAVLHRLLATYPADRLLICESDHNRSDPRNQLPQVGHVPLHLYRHRILCSRFALYYSAWVFHRAPTKSRRLLPHLRKFHPDAVLTVAHGYGWLTAAHIAQQLELPLHIIVHDHWRDTILLPARRWAQAEAAFTKIYRRAASRMPISPAMSARYAASYGVPGTVLYPSRPAPAKALERPPLREPTGSFVFAYAGAAASAGQRQALIAFANAIAPLGARLHVYQQLSLDQLRREGLRGENLTCVAFRPAEELRQDLIANVDALYLPMSFAVEDRANVELCFPSKLVDYTSVGLPILVWCPGYGTAAQWARENAAAAALVTEPEEAAAAQAAGRIITDVQYRHALAHAALDVGKKMFSHEAVFGTLTQCLRAATAFNAGTRQ